MNNHLLFRILTILLAILFTLPMAAQSLPEGVYTGKIEVQGTSLEMIFEFFRDSVSRDDKCHLSVPKQNLTSFPADECMVSDTQFTVVFNSFGARYTGTVDDQGNIAGTWSQGGFTADLNLERAEAGVQAMRPQEPRPPFPYETMEHLVPNPDAPGVSLSGTLTRPRGDGTFPLVILISGSGPQNRNGEVFGHKPFWVIADYLTRHGIGVFRYDERGVGASTGNFQTANSTDFASDVMAIVSYLEENEPQAEKIGLIGHSEGGIVAPMVANQEEGIDFLVLLAAPALPGREILLAQTKALLEKANASPGEIERQIDYARKVYDLVEAAPPGEKLDYDTLKKLTRAFYDTAGDQLKTRYDSYEQFYFAQSSAMSSPWMRFFISHDPAPQLQRIDIPVFAINGSLDVQVPAKENLEKLKTSLGKVPEENRKIWEVPGLNHLFQAASTGLPDEYGEIRETFSEQVLQAMTSWILHVGA